MSDDDFKGAIPSDSVLDETPARALKFFGAVSQFVDIRNALNQRGYDDEIHEKAWALTTKAAGYRKPATGPLVHAAAATALTELDRWDEPNFKAIYKTLHDFPAQQAFVFQDLTPQVGAGAILSVGTLLERLNALESGKDRKATHKADLAAIEKLAARGYDAKLRAHLADLIKVATNQSKSEALSPVSEKEKAEKAKKADQSRSEQREAKIALWRLLDEWSEIARLQITRRDYLIYLGLAKRKKKGKAAPEGGGEPGGDK